MKYAIVFIFLTLGAAAAIAADKETAQEKPWTDEYQYGEYGRVKAPMVAESSEKEKKGPQKTAEKEKRPKTGKPSEGGEYEIAPARK